MVDLESLRERRKEERRVLRDKWSGGTREQDLTRDPLEWARVDLRT